MTKLDTIYKVFLLFYTTGLICTCLCKDDKVLGKDTLNKQNNDIVTDEKLQKNIPVDPGGSPVEANLMTSKVTLQKDESNTEISTPGDREANTVKQTSEIEHKVEKTAESISQYKVGNDVSQEITANVDLKTSAAQTDGVSQQTKTVQALQNTDTAKETQEKQSESMVDGRLADKNMAEKLPVATTSTDLNQEESVIVTENKSKEKDGDQVSVKTATPEKDDQTKEIKAETEKPGQEEFQTFTEFVEENKEAEKKSKQQKLSDLPTAELSPPKPSKRKVNVASQECGAKVITANPEAENTKGILTTNKDDYMINPCKVNKWFVVELCEPVRVKTLEVASFELFSSQPKTFKVHFSEEYPSKSWQSMIPFNATEDRKVHAFPVPETFNNYIKFVKVEMLNHFGEEHYCPLTLFRVLGIAVEYDDIMGRQLDDQDENMDTVMNDNGEGETGAEKDGPKNLFASAKDTVLKIVKKVLNVEDKKDEKDIANKTDKLNDTERKQNTTGHSFMLPCVPDVKTPVIEEKEEDKAPEQIKPATTATEIKDSSKPMEDEVTMVTKLEDHEQIPSAVEEIPVVTLIDTEKEELSLKEMVSKCLPFKSMRKRNLNVKDKSWKRNKNYCKRFCKYIQIMFKYDKVCPKPTPTPSNRNKAMESPHTCTVAGKSSQSEGLHSETHQLTDSRSVTSSSDTDLKSSIPRPCLVPTKTESKSKEDLLVSQSVERKTSSQDSTEVKPSIVLDVTRSSSADIAQSSVLRVESESQSRIQPSTTSDGKAIGEGQKEQTKPGQSTEDNKKIAEDSKISLEPSIVEISKDFNSGNKQKQELHSDVKQKDDGMDPMISTTTPGLTFDVDKSVEVTKQQGPNKIIQTETATKVSVEMVTPTAAENNSTESLDSEQAAMEQMIDRLASVVLDEDFENNSTRTAGKETVKKDLGLVKVPVLPLPKREIALMRLANRINALEMNVSLSIRFLERMSQKFKSKSDELMKLLNKTDKKLEIAINEATQRDKLQQDQINKMESKLQNLTNMVYQLTQHMDMLNQKVTDRQMVWTSIEVVILFMIFLICLRRGKPGTGSTAVQNLIDSKPVEPDPSLLIVSPRRNSFGGTIRHDSSVAKSLGKSLQKHNSETALAYNVAMATTGITEFDPGGATSTVSSNLSQQKEGSKKKKKKRKSQEIKMQSLPQNEGEITLSNTATTFNSAGLLFGSNQGEATSDSDSAENNLSRANSYGYLSNTVEITATSSTTRDVSGNLNATPNVQGKAVSFKCVHCNSDKVPEASMQPVTSVQSNSVIVTKPPKGNSLGGAKTKKGSPQLSRAPGGGQTGTKHKKHSISTEHSPGIIAQTVGPKTIGNGIHTMSNVTGGTTPLGNHNDNASNRSSTKYVRGSSADFSPTKGSSFGGWRKLIGMK